MKACFLKQNVIETSLVVQWIRLHAPNTGDPGSIPGQGTRPCKLPLKSLHAATSESACHSEDRRPHVLQLRPSTAKYTDKNKYFKKGKHHRPSHDHGTGKDFLNRAQKEPNVKGKH